MWPKTCIELVICSYSFLFPFLSHFSLLVAELPRRAFLFMAHPTRFCVEPGLLVNNLLPRWEFSDEPPDGSPVLVLPNRRGKVGVFSIKHRATYLSGVGYLVIDADENTHVVHNPVFSGGVLDFSAPANGFHFNMSFTINDWVLPAGGCTCHRKLVI